MARTIHNLYSPLDEWYSLNGASSAWRYQHYNINADAMTTITILQFGGSDWDIHINDVKIASAGSLDEAKALCPMLIKFHGQPTNS